MRACLLQALLLLPLFLPASCTGEGSDVGPTAPGRAVAFLRGVVEDCQGRPIVSARLRVLSTGQEAPTASSGRFFLPDPVPGLWLCEVDGRFGASAAGTRFGRLRLRLPIPAGPADLPLALVLPDLAAGASIEVAQGVQALETVLESALGRLILPAGSELSLGEPGTGPLGLAEMGEADLPPGLEPGIGLPLATRALLVDPPQARFEPGGSLRIANTLGLSPAGTARLYRLDPATGAWEEGPLGTVSGDGLWVEAPVGSVPGGGLYLFAVDRPLGVSTEVTGLVRTPLGQPVAGALVRASEGRSAVSRSDGSFTLGPLAGTLASGAARQVSLVARAAGGWAPGRTDRLQDLASGAGTVAGDLELETRPTAACQVVGAFRGRAIPWRRIRGGAGDMVLEGRLDRNGLIHWEDVPLGRCTARVGWVEERLWFFGISQQFFSEADRLNSLLLVAGDVQPRPGAIRRGVTVRVVAAPGGGPLAGVELFSGRDPAAGRRGLTDSFGLLWLSGLRGPQVLTAYRSSLLSGRTLKAVFALDGVDNNFFELPLPILVRSTGSDFLPFGELEGALTGAGAGTLAVAGRSRLEPWEMEAALLKGDLLDAQAPARLVPPSFLAGVPLGSSTLVGTETLGGRLERMGLQTRLDLEAGRRARLDLPLDRPAGDSLLLEGALALLDGRTDPDQVTAGLGLELDSGEGILVAQGLSTVVAGGDLRLQVPGLQGALAGASRTVVLTAAAASGGVEWVQRALARGAGASLRPVFLPLPTLLRPTPGSLTEPSGLTLEWSAPPAGTTAILLQCRWTAGAEEGLWEAWVRPDRTAFAFYPLPQGAFSFFPASGTELRFRLLFLRVEGNLIAADHPFDRLIGALSSSEPEELGATALSELRFSTTVP